jgi:hypothetical protein
MHAALKDLLFSCFQLLQLLLELLQLLPGFAQLPFGG